jgi:hypothetical protein
MPEVVVEELDLLVELVFIRLVEELVGLERLAP